MFFTVFVCFLDFSTVFCTFLFSGKNLFLAFSWLYTILVWFYAFFLVVFGPGTLGQAGS